MTSFSIFRKHCKIYEKFKLSFDYFENYGKLLQKSKRSIFHNIFVYHNTLYMYFEGVKRCGSKGLRVSQFIQMELEFHANGTGILAQKLMITFANILHQDFKVWQNVRPGLVPNYSSF